MVGFWGFFWCGFFFVNLFGFYDRDHQNIMLTEPDFVYWKGVNSCDYDLAEIIIIKIMVALKYFCQTIIVKEMMFIEQASRSKRFSLSCERREEVTYIPFPNKWQNEAIFCHCFKALVMDWCLKILQMIKHYFFVWSLYCFSIVD